MKLTTHVDVYALFCLRLASECRQITSSIELPDGAVLNRSDAPLKGADHLIDEIRRPIFQLASELQQLEVDDRITAIISALILLRDGELLQHFFRCRIRAIDDRFLFHGHHSFLKSRDSLKGLKNYIM